MKFTLTWPALAALVLLSACGGGDKPASQAKFEDDAIASNGSYSHQDGAAGFSSGVPLTREALLKSAPQTRAQVAPSASVVLGALPESAKLAVQQSNAQAKSAAVGESAEGVALQIGSTRAVAATQTSDALARQLRWTRGDVGAQVAAIRFESTGAKGLRLGILVEQLPAEATLRFFSGDGAEAQTVTASSVLKGIARNVAADGDTPEARTYWSPDLGGASTTMEIELPAGVAASELRISVPTLAHAFIDVLSDEVAKFNRKIGESASCHNDYACKPEKPDVGRAVARMVYPKGSGYFLCTGTLLADTQNSQRPYFLTAHHCISGQTEATGMQTYWFYETDTCGGSAASPATRRKTDGARLLFTANQTDSTLMLLNSAPPEGAYYAGWYAAAAPLNLNVLGIHHPAGDVKKYSEGRVTSYQSCSNGSGRTYSCWGGEAQGTNFLNVRWSSGITEGGSSGSGLFARTSVGDYRTVGQLLGGSDSCQNIGGGSQYGRFDVSYQLGMFQWLNASATTPAPASTGGAQRR